MTIIGFAADVFPIYYKDTHFNAFDSLSSVIEMSTIYQLKSGERLVYGISAPCRGFTGVYSNDYKFLQGLGFLDEGSGFNIVIPEFPNGTYHYVLTDEIPSISVYFSGLANNSFELGGPKKLYLNTPDSIIVVKVKLNLYFLFSNTIK